jgi:hypothetical protein
MFSCKDITEHASEYLEKELTFSKRLNMRLHLFMCLNCRRYVKQLQITVQTLGRMRKKEEPVGEAYNQHLMECFKKECQSSQKSEIK